MKFKVSIPEIHYFTTAVEAENEKEAKEKAKTYYEENDWDCFYQHELEFSHAESDEEKWLIETIE